MDGAPPLPNPVPIFLLLGLYYEELRRPGGPLKAAALQAELLHEPLSPSRGRGWRGWRGRGWVGGALSEGVALYTAAPKRVVTPGKEGVPSPESEELLEGGEMGWAHRAEQLRRQSVIRVVVELSDKGELSVNGPLHDKVICVGLLELGKAAVLQQKQAEEQRVVPVGIMPKLD